jgi:hypothetical protein
MTTGALMFAFNGDIDYVKMASISATRVKTYLNLPTTLITDESTNIKSIKHIFDNVEIIEKDDSNYRNKKKWNNKGRFNAFRLSPYDNTILLDSDYVVNSDKLLKNFDYFENFLCHKSSEFIMHDYPNEKLSDYSYDSMWATVMYFDKSQYSRDIFEALQMVQENYEYYQYLHQITPTMYRNDYGLTLALNLINGHLSPESNFIKYNLLHCGNDVRVTKLSDTKFKINKNESYQIIDNLDFHMIDKTNFMEIFD